LEKYRETTKIIKIINNTVQQQQQQQQQTSIALLGSLLYMGFCNLAYLHNLAKISVGFI
jgi:hypothetical protein